MITLNQINEFLAPKKLAVVGVSRNEKKFGKAVFNHLVKNGFDVCPVNSMTDEIDGLKCYRAVKEIPDDFKKLLVVTPKDQTLDVLKQAKEKGINQIWIQQGSENKEVLEYVKKENLHSVYKKCIFMFIDPVTGGHKFHRSIMKFFGAFPKMN